MPNVVNTSAADHDEQTAQLWLASDPEFEPAMAMKYAAPRPAETEEGSTPLTATSLRSSFTTEESKLTATTESEL